MTFSDPDLLEDVLQIVFDECDHDVALLRGDGMQASCDTGLYARAMPIK
jgi:hypothetical protein